MLGFICSFWNFIVGLLVYFLIIILIYVLVFLTASGYGIVYSETEILCLYPQTIVNEGSKFAHIQRDTLFQDFENLTSYPSSELIQIFVLEH
jgi:hypothetical protein